MKSRALKIAAAAALAIVALAVTTCGGGGGGGTVGNSAKDLLTATTYTSLKIVTQSMTGFEPTTNAMNALQSFLQARLNKPAGITVVTDPAIAPQGKSSYTLDDVTAIESANRKTVTTGSVFALYMLFLDGHSSSDAGSSVVLGQAYGATSIVIYEKAVRDNAGDGITKPTLQTIETAVFEHEAGHLMGLVNIGTPMVTPHQDTAHGNHCNNTNCLMYYATDTSDILANLLGGIPALDANCLADLKANGGK